ncbi:MAG: hypothetical protein Q9163_001322 [Psora crenata]
MLAASAPLKPEIKLAQALADYEKILSDEDRNQLHTQGVPDAMAAINLTTTEFGPYERDIANSGQEVRDEASLASKQAQKQEIEFQARERSEALKHRKVMVKLRESIYQNGKEEKDLRLEIRRRKLEKKKLQALDSLSTYDYQKTYKQIRKECVPGTSSWILENLEFKTWKEGNSKALWCSGKYAFRDVNLAATYGPAIVKFLEAMLSTTRQYLIVLDGLEECNEEQSKEVAGIFHSLLSSPLLHIKLFWSSRPNVPTWLPLKFRTQQHISLDTVESQSHVALDIREFISTSLGEWLEGDAPEMRISDPTLILTIADHLEREAHGMYATLISRITVCSLPERFLWVKLQLQTLREQNSDKQILAALNKLPRDLPGTFERILSKFTKADDIDIGSQIFRWTAVVKRPLTTGELREAIGIEPLQETWDDRAFINDMKKAVACCGNLTFIEEEHQTIHFTHSSVKKYLCSTAITKFLSRYYIDLGKADADVGVTCLTYLNSPVFNTQVVRATQMDINATGIASMVVKDSLPIRKTGNKIALSLLRSRRKSSKSVHRLLEETMGDTEINRQRTILRQYLFLPYARQFWLEHTKRSIVPGSKKLWRLWCKSLEAGQGDTLCSTPWTFEEWEKRSTNVLGWISDHNHCSLAEVVVGSKKIRLLEQNLLILINGAAAQGYVQLLEVCLGSKDMSQTILESALQTGAGLGHLPVVERLLQETADVNTTAALEAAAGGGHLPVVKRLLQEKADIKTAAALEAAAGGGHLAVVKRLLQEEASFYIITGTIALQTAARGGHLAVVERLLQEKVDTRSIWIAFDAAAGEGHLAVVERLLQEKVDIKSIGSALYAAAKVGHLAVVERLLQEKVNIKAIGSALYSAAGEGHLAVVGRLLQEEVDTHSIGIAFETAAGGEHLAVVERLLQEKVDIIAIGSALSTVAGRGYLAVVERLLQEKVDIHSIGIAFEEAARWGRLAVVERLLQEEVDFQSIGSAFYAAARGGHLAIMERLLQEKVDINYTPYNGRTALQEAAGEGHLAIVKRLLQEKVDIDSIRSALQKAAERGYLTIVERLLREKVDINSIGSALQQAAGGGSLAVVGRLLQEKVNINSFGPALRKAARGGYLTIVERLLQEEVDIYYIRLTLYTAAEEGYLAVVERLLQERTDINSIGPALEVAAGGGHLAIVERLLQEKIDIDTMELALQAAAEGEHLPVVERLCAAGAK